MVAASIFTLKMDAAWTFEMLASYFNTTHHTTSQQPRRTWLVTNTNFNGM